MKTKFLRESPPRYIDVFSQATLLFSGFLQQFGWSFFAFGMVFFWAFGMQSSLRTVTKPLGETVETTGTLLSVVGTAASENEEPIYRYTFTYIVDYREYEGVSYGFWQSAYNLQEGGEVPVIYSVEHPERALVKGSRRSVFSGWVLFVLLFPFIGLVFILLGLRQNAHYLRLLRIGQATTGTMMAKDPTGSTVTINNKTYPVYKYTFHFEVGGKTFKATAKTHVTERLEDEAREIVLFDPLDPAQNVLFDSVSSGPRIDKHGYLKPAPAWKMVLFILPILAILVNFFGYLLTR